MLKVCVHESSYHFLPNQLCYLTIELWFKDSTVNRSFVKTSIELHSKFSHVKSFIKGYVI